MPPRATHYRIVVEEESTGRVRRTFEHMPASFVEGVIGWIEQHTDLAHRVAQAKTAFETLISNLTPRKKRIGARR